MKKILLILIVALLPFSLSASTSIPDVEADNSEQTDRNKDDENNPENLSVFVVYYSYSGITKKISERLSELLNTTTYEIKTVKPYPTDKRETARISQEERNSGNLPDIVDDLPDLSSFDIILIGGPIWNGHLATPLMQYMKKTDFKGKKVAAFYTDEGYIGSYRTDFEQHADNTEVLQSLGITWVENKSEEEIDTILNNWILKIVDNK